MSKNNLCESVYFWKVRPCWRCHKVLRLYTWPGHRLYPKNCPVFGRPASLQSFYVKFSGRRYYSNVCLRCGAIQGDWYLYKEPGGAFFVPR